MAVWPSIERTKRLRSYADFRGGLNTDAAPDHVADNELVIAENVDLLERGGITKRKGTVKLNQEPYGAPVEQLIEWPRDNGEEWLLAVIGDHCAGYGRTRDTPQNRWRRWPAKRWATSFCRTSCTS